MSACENLAAASSELRVATDAGWRRTRNFQEHFSRNGLNPEWLTPEWVLVLVLVVLVVVLVVLAVVLVVLVVPGIFPGT